MKSKISFINRTMLQKECKTFTGQSGHCIQWCYYSTVRFPWSRFKNAEFIYGKNWHSICLISYHPISMGGRYDFYFVMALVTGMANVQLPV